MERRDLSREPENLKETPRGMPSQRPRGKGCRSMPLLAQTKIGPLLCSNPSHGWELLCAWGGCPWGLWTIAREWVSR